MRLFARLLSLLMLAATTVLALSIRTETGGEFDTRAPSQALAEMKQETAEDPFADLGMNDAVGKPKDVENRFRMGWIPGMSSLGDSASVATLILPSLVLTVVVFVATRKRKVG